MRLAGCLGPRAARCPNQVRAPIWLRSSAAHRLRNKYRFVASVHASICSATTPIFLLGVSSGAVTNHELQMKR